MIRKVGRPTIYNKELADEICETIATSTVGLPQLCKENSHWPAHQTIHQWRLKYVEFSDKYAVAKQSQIESLVDELIHLTKNHENDFYTDSDGKKCIHTPYIQRLRCHIDTVKWLACKLAPKLYGNKVKVEGELSLQEQLQQLKGLE